MTAHRSSSDSLALASTVVVLSCSVDASFLLGPPSCLGMQRRSPANFCDASLPTCPRDERPFPRGRRLAPFFRVTSASHATTQARSPSTPPCGSSAFRLRGRDIRNPTLRLAPDALRDFARDRFPIREVEVVPVLVPFALGHTLLAVISRELPGTTATHRLCGDQLRAVAHQCAASGESRALELPGQPAQRNPRALKFSRRAG